MYRLYITLISLVIALASNCVASAEIKIEKDLLSKPILVNPTKATNRVKTISLRDYQKQLINKKRQAKKIGRIQSLESYSWNLNARNLVIKTGMNPPQASRLYAYLSVAQSDSLASINSSKLHGIRADKNNKVIFGCEKAAVAASSIAILNFIFPLELESISQKEQESDSRLLSQCLDSEMRIGKFIGKSIAKKVIEYAKNDNSDDSSSYNVPLGAQYWKQTNKPPLLPNWGKVKTWTINNVETLRPEPPPAIDSEEFKAALREVREISDTRTQEQLRVAEFWADGPGTSTPPGHWNEIAIEMLSAEKANEAEAAKILAVMNLAMMDAAICCWDTKYAYWLIRPSQYDPAITTPVGLPNFPAYTSGHSTFSGAAATVLSSALRRHRNSLSNMATQASLSRIYGGIHYRFDSEVGMRSGKMIGISAIKKFLR